MTTTVLMIYVITWAIWAWFLVYGRNEKMVIPTVSWLTLCVYPYFVQNIFSLIIIWLLLTIIPFFIKF